MITISVEKMTMMNIIGDINSVDEVLKDIVLSGRVDLVSAMSQIEDNSFVFNVGDENLEKVLDLNYITTFKKDLMYEQTLKKARELEEVLNIKDVNMKSNVTDHIDREDISNELDRIYNEIKLPSDKLQEEIQRLERIEHFYKSFNQIRDVDIPIKDLKGLRHFTYKFGILAKEDKLKLKKNYENILAVILHTGSVPEGDVYFVLYPSSLDEEMERILRSLNFREITIPEEYSGTPGEILEKLNSKREEVKSQINDLERDIEKHRTNYKDKISYIINYLTINEKIEDIKKSLARSNKFFYLSGWVAVKDKDKIESDLKRYKDTLIIYKDESALQPPTKLRNIKLFKPFEYLVKMYGIPSYNELDPTPFLSITYMLLFGAMFGDLGQGLVLLLGGFILGRRNKVFGGLLSRIGLSSMIFGVLYGSLFGFEDIIPALLIRPFENINTVLAAAVGIGVVLLLIAYIYGMINSYKRRDMENGLFGKNGLTGFVFYITLLLLVGGTFLDLNFMPMFVGIPIILICILLMVFKQPLTNLIKGKRPLHSEAVSGYYIESGFSIIETLLSMLSGTVSFIRVGAFALTHVGLFIAFETIGEMIGSAAGNIIVLIIGNIVIIGLEGLIVLIQGLRLQYYELFSRYYEGEGQEFNPVNIE